MIPRPLAAVFLLFAAAGAAMADAGSDWDQVVAMDNAGPSGRQWRNREEAVSDAIAYMGRQEEALRRFITAYPADPRAADAKLRLAHLLAARADLRQEPADRRQSGAILDRLEQSDPARRADVAFARISIFMQRADAASGANRDTLLEKARGFAQQYPGDRRIAPLLAEVASVYEDEPATERSILEQARPLAPTPELRSRIDDDLKRIAMLGKPLLMRWTAVRGQEVDLAKLRGRVVLVYFFASWSAPSIAELKWVDRLAASLYPESIQAVGICLDNDPVQVPGMLAGHGIRWPVYCDGHGWQGTLVRSLAINALPTLWIVDRKGVLRILDAGKDAPGIIARLARQGE